MTTAILLGAFGAYCFRAARDVDGTPGAQWFHAILDYDQLKTRFAHSWPAETKLRGLGWLSLAFSARAFWAAWSA